MKSLVAFVYVSCLSICQAARCPFPGLKSGARFTNALLNARTSFAEGDIVTFECLPGAYLAPDQVNSISCQANGSWTAPPPRCAKTLRSSGNQLDIRYWKDDYQPWTRSSQCVHNVRSRLYLISTPLSYRQSISHVVFNTCGDWYDLSALNVSMGDGSRCVEVPDDYYAIYNCENDDTTVARKIVISFDRPVRLKFVQLFINEGNNCGSPPVPAGANLVAEVVAGQTTSVTFRCRSGDLSGPESIQCDSRTGDWSPLPTCSDSTADNSNETSLVASEDTADDMLNYDVFIVSIVLSCVVFIIALCAFLWKSSNRFFGKPSTEMSQSYNPLDQNDIDIDPPMERFI